MPVRPLLLAAAVLLSSCNGDRFDQRYRDAEEQIRKEDRDLASELPTAATANPASAQPTGTPATRP